MVGKLPAQLVCMASLAHRDRDIIRHLQTSVVEGLIHLSNITSNFGQLSAHGNCDLRALYICFLQSSPPTPVKAVLSSAQSR